VHEGREGELQRRCAHRIVFGSKLKSTTRHETGTNASHDNLVRHFTR